MTWTRIKSDPFGKQVSNRGGGGEKKIIKFKKKKIKNPKFLEQI